MGKLESGKRLSDHLAETFEGSTQEKALASVKDVKTMTKNHPELVEAVVEDASRRNLTVEAARVQLVEGWIRDHLESDQSKARGKGKGKAAATGAADDDDDDDDDAGGEPATGAAG